MDGPPPSSTTPTTDPSKLESTNTTTTLPPLPLNLSTHKPFITLHWLPIMLTSGILPITLYFALHYGTSLSLTVVLTIPLVLMGVVSLTALLRRSWRLSCKESACRPLGCEAMRWSGDFFHWNFLGGFVVLTVVISVEIGVGSLCALPLSLPIFYISVELLIAQVAMRAGWRTPVRMSSLPRGSPTHPGTFILVEDVVAVDGGLGREWREVWGRRYEADGELRALLRRLDLLWAINKDIGYTVGWGLPWVWAGDMVVITIWMVKRMLRRQRGR
ncbi:hypothetical protein M409DRAFT_63746 [Zasmidium cellare ATCC 36951]|uniref:Uncharacterized protein n=1 Tax=Zasmidium cellare ATCC 36951 TaxID=1080233 RepID=A0A6A6D022_ZASCE|nr:uncharacterized protein M409DRAFT_63746 [Zasmidium cellare ATCC 36951]KAF2171502.1 hypothetical protein M409DRAFT_63746 [Zasmidium cellare ATCC 36951]